MLLVVNTSAAPRTPVYFAMTGAVVRIRHRIQVALTAAQLFSPYFWNACGVDCCERCPAVGIHVGHVLLVQDGILPSAQSAHVAANEVGPLIGECFVCRWLVYASTRSSAKARKPPT